MEETEKYYVSSEGKVLKIKDMDTVHIVNSYAKKIRELYGCKNKKQFNEIRITLNNLNEEINNRLDKCVDLLEDE